MVVQFLSFLMSTEKLRGSGFIIGSMIWLSNTFAIIGEGPLG
jgi:hypothetical protein